MAKRKRFTDDETLVNCIVNAMQEKKARQIVTINFEKLQNSVSDYFIICHGDNTPQVQAIASGVEFNVRKEVSLHPTSVEGVQNAEWILIDFGSVVVHIFKESARRFYHIEDLWADADFVKYPEVG
jgi:ribosome-associated protein